MKKRVLIFDDDADILEVCSIVLESNGFEVMTRKNCDDVVGMINLHTPDVVLMDNKIPPRGGIPASKEIRASEGNESIPIVLFSANKDVARLAREAGADWFIEKPFDLDHLVLMIRQASSEVI
jgi:DNA-binding response OmpR family regulator